MLSKKALTLINLVFGKKSNIQFPAATAKEIVKIREWTEKQIKKTEKDKPQKLTKFKKNG